MSVDVLSIADQAVLFAQVARRLAQAIVDLGAAHEVVVGGWCGGRSPIPLFPYLVEELKALSPEVNRRHHLFQVDERLYYEFNQLMLAEKFVAPACAASVLRAEQMHFYPVAERAYAEDHGTRVYEEELARYGGRFHYVVLGTGLPHLVDVMGRVVAYDCHVAATFARHPSTVSEAAQRPGFMAYDVCPKPPPWRVTATPALLRQSDLGVLLVIGEEKDGTLRTYLNPTVPPEDCPAKVVRGMSSRLIATDRPVSTAERALM